jgi:hypothetical protein
LKETSYIQSLYVLILLTLVQGETKKIIFLKNNRNFIALNECEGSDSSFGVSLLLSLRLTKKVAQASETSITRSFAVD